MKKLLPFLFVLLAHASASGQQSDFTTFILVRHAEKQIDGTKDPDLSEAGKKRAELLAMLLKRTKIDAVYSTGYKRSRNTVVPLAVSKGLGVSGYDATKLTEVDRIFEQWRGGTVVLCGHSNTIPETINYLISEPNKYKDFEDDEYGNLVIILLHEKGRRAKVTWLTY